MWGHCKLSSINCKKRLNFQFLVWGMLSSGLSSLHSAVILRNKVVTSEETERNKSWKSLFGDFVLLAEFENSFFSRLQATTLTSKNRIFSDSQLWTNLMVADFLAGTHFLETYQKINCLRLIHENEFLQKMLINLIC